MSDSEANLRDVRAYIRASLTNPRVLDWMAGRGLNPEEFVEKLLRSSEGNFMYLHHVLLAIGEGKFNFGLQDLPCGLEEYYRQHWKQMQREDPLLFEQVYQPVVCVLAAAREAVSVDDVARWTDLPLLEVRRVLTEWREFLDEQRGRDRRKLYRIYHAAFREWLQEEVDPGLRTYHAMIDDAIERKVLGVKDRPSE